MKPQTMRPGRRFLLAAFSGALLAVAFPGSGGQHELAFVALIPLMFAIHGVGWGEAAILGFLSGLAFWLLTIPWIAGTMVQYGGVPWAVSSLILLGLAGYLACYTAAFCAFLVRSPLHSGALHVVLAASFWVALEFVRTYALTGFPWNLLGYSQYRNLPLIQIASVTGVYGVSFAIVAVNAALARFVAEPAGRQRLGALAAAGAFAAAALGTAWLSPPASDRAPVPVALLQASVEQGVKWDRTLQDATLEIYRRLTREAARSGAAVIVWPETAVPFFLRDDPRWPEVAALARENNAHLLVGAPDVWQGARRNSAFLVGPEGTLRGRYDKRHLVPFGEYVPLVRLLSFAGAIAGSGIGAFAPGSEATLFETPAGRLAVVICYESIFPAEVREFFRDGAEVLVNITNDAWFGRSAAPVQHLAMAIFRAVENRAYLLRAANTGISAIVAPDGQVVQASGLFTREVLTGTVVRRGAPSFYTRYGDLFAWTTVAVALAVLWPVFEGAATRRWSSVSSRIRRRREPAA